MLEVNARNMVVAGTAIALTAVAAIGTYFWCSRTEDWDSAKADDANEAVLDAYNDAIAQFPGDHNKASFAFEMAAKAIRDQFVTANEAFPEELEKWTKAHDAQVKSLKVAIRKV